MDNPDREEIIITDHAKSYLEKIFTDYRPRAEVVFSKKRGQDRRDNLEINLEEFISVKGITAMGNQLTKEKVLEINALDPLPYEPPKPKDTLDIEVVDEENVATGTTGGKLNPNGEEDQGKGDNEQTSLFCLDQGQGLQGKHRNKILGKTYRT